MPCYAKTPLPYRGEATGYGNAHQEESIKSEDMWLDFAF